MKKIAIIGSESFLSRNLIKYLKKYYNDSFDIFCYDFVEKSKSKDCIYKQIDFANSESVSKIDFKVDAVLCFIGKTGTINGFLDFESFITVNEIYFLRILNEYVKQKSSARFLYPSSRLLFKSNNYRKIDENGDREKKSIYAVTKQAAEDYLYLYNQVYGLDYTILRICTPFGSIIDNDGSYGTFEIFRNQAKKNGIVTIFGDGLDKKTYTDIRDICDAFYRLITADTIMNRDYNLGGQTFSMNDAVSLIVRDLNPMIIHTPWPKEYLLVDGGTVVFDSSRFDKEFNMQYRMINFSNVEEVE